MSRMKSLSRASPRLLSKKLSVDENISRRKLPERLSFIRETLLSTHRHQNNLSAYCDDIELLSSSSSSKTKHVEHSRRDNLALEVLDSLSDVLSSIPKASAGFGQTTNSSFSSSSCALSITSSYSNDCLQPTNTCKWESCDSFSDINFSGLLSHIQDAHVNPQISSTKSQYVCLWNGCKVYGQPSVSSNWLIRHVLHHTEAKGKPFSCIFDSCCLRFSSTTSLERHIQRIHVQKVSTLKSTVLQASPHNSAEIIIPSTPSASTAHTKNPVIVKSCSRKTVKRRRKLRCYRVRRTDFYDFRSKTIIKNRLILDRMLEQMFSQHQPDNNCEVEPLSRLPCPLINEPDQQLSSSSSVSVLTASRRRLRSSAGAPSSSPFSLSAPNQPPLCEPVTLKPENYRVKLLLTVPHTFVGQRLSRDNNTEYLVKWLGDLCSGTLPVMWVLESEVQAAARLDKL